MCKDVRVGPNGPRTLSIRIMKVVQGNSGSAFFNAVLGEGTRR